MTIRRQRIPEVPGRGRLGRHLHHDDRSRGFPAELAPQIASVTHQSSGLPLDQGEAGSCTAEALCGCLNTEPAFEPDPPDATVQPLTQAFAYSLYAREVALEGGTYPPDDPGGSGLLVCQAAKSAGLISSYAHVFSAGDALKALMLRPGMFGINWYTSMDSPDSNGVVEVTPAATVRGGHEVFAYGLDVPDELIWFWNSWGASFGVGGRFAMRFATAERLLGEDGDMTFPVK